MPERQLPTHVARAPPRALHVVKQRLAAPSDRHPRTARDPGPHRRTGSHPRATSHRRYPVEGGWWDPRLELRSSFTARDYLDAVARVREYIFAGDIFQANLSQRFEAPLAEPPWAFYTRLRRRNAAPFAAFLDFPEATVVSASPERFLRVDAARPRRDAADQRARGRAASAPSTTRRSARRWPRAPRIAPRT